MNNSQARFILHSFRSDGSDARDPVFQEALEHARHDPSTERWLAAEMENDRLIVEKLRGVAAPAALRDQILAAHRAQARVTFWTTRRRWLALAASLLILAGGSSWFALRPAPLAYGSFAGTAVGFLSRPFGFDVETKSLEDLQAWMRARGGAADARIPNALAAAVESGVRCHSFNWRGQNIELVCFTLEGGQPVHFFVMDARGLPDAPEDGQLLYAKRGKWATGTWKEGRKVYVLATLGERRDVEALL